MKILSWVWKTSLLRRTLPAPLFHRDKIYDRCRLTNFSQQTDLEIDLSWDTRNPRRISTSSNSNVWYRYFKRELGVKMLCLNYLVLPSLICFCPGLIRLTPLWPAGITVISPPEFRKSRVSCSIFSRIRCLEVSPSFFFFTIWEAFRINRSEKAQTYKLGYTSDEAIANSLGNPGWNGVQI